ncbi:MAG: hypothetical protein A3G59_00870 [Candidatus Taylorbacteria bacterium RIFCSPLOWO2_12_FULL_47_20]|uniref:Transposase IS200-like domain-containing protein n=1 Tax=Candidatus Taylorbacteria bacterium RIFCSPLOWO2_12_FULL_47_20 TaxID=1802335 RepID=A0A1G2PAE5_9BACT|nr:MAG: hypothetical protein A3G59_00870 [Candidatus Taylorbacteria bacterium RIFCSPLOWO2_12_FULL_47_20]
MKRVSFPEGSYVHVFNRGAKKMPIYREKSDQWRMLFGLFYFNSVYLPSDWVQALRNEDCLPKFVWPKDKFGERSPLVSILAYTIMPNHFHLVLKEKVSKGISMFMHKFCMGYSKFINAKYSESGTIFQGPFKSVPVLGDEHLRYLAVYIMVKNVFELFPGGLTKATDNFDAAFDFALNYPFSSLPDYAGARTSKIISRDIYGGLFPDRKQFKEFARDCIVGRNKSVAEFLEGSMFDE